MVSIEFTDRYGGNIPSWLRGCFHCEAMGVVPVPPDNYYDISASSIDDWTFEQCRYCNGSARCSWIDTCLRFPGWLVKGIRFTIRERHFAGIKASFKAGILADLGLWRPGGRR